MSRISEQKPSANSAGQATGGRYSAQEIDRFVQQLLTDGYCILPGHFPVETMQRWQTAFEMLMLERIENGTASARGPARYYISLPFAEPFADPAIYEDLDILAIVEQAAGGDIVMPELASDTPLQGSDYQVIHRDHLLLSPDLPGADPARPFQFGVNFALVDVTTENGPFEIAPGTHLMSDEESRQKIKSGEIEPQLIPLEMKLGDVMIRDVRALHRGTPNRTDVPRPMIVVGYNRVEHKRPQLRIFIPKDMHEKLSPRGKQLLRLNPVVDSLDQATKEAQQETYSNLYFLDD